MRKSSKTGAWILLSLLPQLAYSLHILRTKIRNKSIGSNETPRAPSSALATVSTQSNSEIRGDRYGVANNSTIPTPEEAAAAVGVKASINASKKTWKRVWRLHGAALPLLHVFDSCKPKDSSLSLRCLWLKALSGNDVSSPVFDNGLSFDLLPPFFRKIVGRRLQSLYPRLHHANIEMRTAFIDKAVRDIISSLRSREESAGDEAKRIRLVSIGAGYDVRSVKFIEQQAIDEAIELDLPQVVKAKQLLLGPKRLLRRRPWLKESDLPRLIDVDLNKVDDVRNILEDVLMHGSESTWRTWHTIFVFEGVMIYLHEGVPSKLLDLCSSVLIKNELEGSLCFADRLENSPGGDEDLGRAELSRNGWELIAWSPKPGLARHMGSARLLHVTDGQRSKVANVSKE